MSTTVSEPGFQLKSGPAAKLPFPANVDLSCFKDAGKGDKKVEDDFNAKIQPFALSRITAGGNAA